MKELKTNQVLNGPKFRDESAPGGKFLLKPVFSGRRKFINNVGILVWLITLGIFWTWWFLPEHIISVPRFVVISFFLMWAILIPAYFVFIFAQAKIPYQKSNPINGRIAMIVTKAPSEPFSVVKKTLRAMLSQQGYSYDTWLADEDPSPSTLRWCKNHGVKVSSRKGVEAYHQKSWPRRTHCKEGNLAYFYDFHGYKEYDFVSQFDADHVPDPTYLIEIMRPFADPSVGYVSAPSICDANAKHSWSARGRLYVEASLHGSLQAGYNNDWAPLCIGSHYAVRTKALQQVGGLGPELAEDHSTTLLLNSGGWKGVHAINAIAHGDGPATFADLAIQEFQWSRSLVTILLKYSSTYTPKLNRRRKFQFLFSQLWYPLFSSLMMLMFILPIYALLSGQNYVNVTYFEFLAHTIPVSTILLILALWWRSTGTFRPSDAKIVSWEGAVFLFARWPWALLGSVDAVRIWLSNSYIEFRITPKGSTHATYLPIRFLVPYAFLSLASSSAAYFISDAGTATGFYLFAIANAIIYGLLLVVIIIKHSIENSLPLYPRSVSGLLQSLVFFTIISLPVTATYEHGANGLKAFNVGIEAFTLTKTTYRISGAGRGSVKQPIVRLNPHWNSDSERRLLREKTRYPNR